MYLGRPTGLWLGKPQSSGQISAGTMGWIGEGIDYAYARWAGRSTCAIPAVAVMPASGRVRLVVAVRRSSYCGE